MSLLEPPKQILSLLRASLPASVKNGDVEKDEAEETVSYVAFLAAGLCEAQDFTPASWSNALQPYLDTLEGCDGGDLAEKFRDSAETALTGGDDQDSYGGDDDEGFEEVCNIKFK